MALGICKRNIAIFCIITFSVVCYIINRLSITGYALMYLPIVIEFGLNYYKTFFHAYNLFVL